MYIFSETTVNWTRWYFFEIARCLGIHAMCVTRVSEVSVVLDRISKHMSPVKRLLTLRILSLLGCGRLQSYRLRQFQLQLNLIMHKRARKL